MHMSQCDRKAVMWVLALALLMAFCARSAHAETSIYVAGQPGLSLVLKAEGEDFYATYLRTVITCRGAGSHWFETSQANHWAFQQGPQKLQRSGRRIRLVRNRRVPFGSEGEAIKGEVQPDRIVGTWSTFASGEGVGGRCEQDAPGFEPEFGEREPPVSFEAQRYVPLDSPLATMPDPTAEALYFVASKALEIYLWIGGQSVTRVYGTVELTCESRKGELFSKRAALGLASPFALSYEDSFDARAALDYGFRTRAVRMTGSVDAVGAVGSFHAASTQRDDGRLAMRCRTGSRGGDGYVGYRAIRYVLARGKPVTTGG
jgi:hypothetical protein